MKRTGALAMMFLGLNVIADNYVLDTDAFGRTVLIDASQVNTAGSLIPSRENTRTKSRKMSDEEAFAAASELFGEQDAKAMEKFVRDTEKRMSSSRPAVSEQDAKAIEKFVRDTEKRMSYPQQVRQVEEKSAWQIIKERFKKSFWESYNKASSSVNK